VCIDQSTDPLQTPQTGLLLLGKILGKEQRAQEIVQYVNDQIKVVSSQLEKITTPEPTVYFECGDTGPSKYSSAYAGADDQSWGSILSRLRIKNIGDAKGVDPQLSPEYVLKSNPDIIVITGQNWTSQADSMKLGFLAETDKSRQYLAAYSSRSGWNDLSAVKNKRVYSVFRNFSMHIYDFAGYQALAKFFYPEDFKELNPEKNYQDFFEKFMPIKYSGVWMLSLD
jgi:iron complex transport system substrate-binding protein